MGTDKFEEFKKTTGLNVSRSTFYRLQADARAGNNSRLGRILIRELVPPDARLHKSIEYLTSPTANTETYSAFRYRQTPNYEKDKRPFLAFDGEGRTLEGKHKYVLLASSGGKHIYNPEGLSTRECLNFLLQTQRQNAIRIFYSFGYDVQQMLVDLPDELLVRLMHGQLVRFGPYRLSYMPGKIFIVNNIRFYDVFSFWQKSFIKAVKESLGSDAVSDQLVKGKESRSDFAEWDIADILRYTNEELSLLVRLAEHLRSLFLRADIHLGSSFYGPGAIANYWFKRYKISPPAITDPIIVDVMERAYYGGRFENFRIGKIEPIYESDLNSAYPAVLADLPYLDQWTLAKSHKYTSGNASEFSLWHVEWHLSLNTIVGPFPSRDKHGLISYPANGKGWYWKPEVDAAIALHGKERFKILGGYEPGIIEGRPFEWVKDIYEERQKLKRANDPAERAYKIGANSLYGKTAQRVGKAKYFSLAWAGYITSATRAKLLHAAVKIGQENIVAFATDAAYYTKPAELDFGSGLGQFTKEIWDRGYFIQSGVYRLERKASAKDLEKAKAGIIRLQNGKYIKDAYRGYHVDKGIQDIFDQIEKSPHIPPRLYTTKFIGHIEAIKCPKALGQYRLSFIIIEKQIQPFKTTKRKVTDRAIWRFLDNGEWIAPGTTAENIEDALTKKQLTAVLKAMRQEGNNVAWIDYRLILKRCFLSSILENHNDHSDYFSPQKIGELEESYPFTRITKREDDLALQQADEIVVERIGGAYGIIPSHLSTKLPVVREDTIIEELESNNG